MRRVNLRLCLRKPERRRGRGLPERYLLRCHCCMHPAWRFVGTIRWRAWDSTCITTTLLAIRTTDSNTVSEGIFPKSTTRLSISRTNGRATFWVLISACTSSSYSLASQNALPSETLKIRTRGSFARTILQEIIPASHHQELLSSTILICMCIQVQFYRAYPWSGFSIAASQRYVIAPNWLTSTA